MSRNQQIQNFIDALEQADGISVDADLTAESITIEDEDGDTAHITEGGRLLVSFPEPLDVSDATVPVTDDGTFEINSLPEPVDVSGSVVTVEDAGTFAIDSLPEPLDVSSATVTITDDGTLDVNSISAVVETTTPSTTAGSSYGVQQTDDTATLVLGANENRESVLLQNKGSEAVYVGFDDTVSSLNGVEIAAGGTYADDTYTGDLYAITGGGTVNVAFQEIATQ